MLREFNLDSDENSHRYYRSNVRDTPLEDLLVKPKKQKHNSRQSNNPRPTTSNVNDNALVHELREKLKGRHLRDVIIDGANIGRTYVFITIILIRFVCLVMV